jgi:hypothetical protein
MTEIAWTDPDRIDALFIQNGASFSAQNDEITLHDVGDATVYFSNNPRREAGHMASGRFLELWSDETASFATAPPRAVLSFLDQPAEALADIVLVLHEPRLNGHEMTYRVEVVDGNLPSSGGPCSLFIDALRRPLASASVVGARRRQRPPMSPQAL